MPAQPPPPPEITLLTALQTVFSPNGHPPSFLRHSTAQIRLVETSIIDTCAKSRIRIDDNLYALLESRDALAEQTHDIDTATASASQVTAAVEKAAAALAARVQVRQNLDKALAVAAQTRKLTRMYARIEDTIDARRLYTAFRMLKVLEEETRCMKPGTILRELVPDSHRLRATITMHARKGLHSWLANVRKSEAELGAYALFHANKQTANRHGRGLLNSSRLGSAKDAYSLPTGISTARGGGGGSGEPSTGIAWTPLLASQAGSPDSVLSRASTSLPYSSQHIALTGPVKTAMPAESNYRPEIGSDARAGMREFTSEYPEEAPTLHLRPLLQSILVNDGLELLGDLRADYRRERQAHLKKILDETTGAGNRTRLTDRESVREMGPKRAQRVENFVFHTCGFFVVERAVEMHANPQVLHRSVVDNEWWAMAYPRMQTLLREQEECSILSPAGRAWARSLLGNVDRFAQANEFTA